MTKFQKKIKDMFPNENWHEVNQTNSPTSWYFYFKNDDDRGFQINSDDTVEFVDDKTIPYIPEKQVSLEYMIKSMKLQNFR